MNTGYLIYTVIERSIFLDLETANILNRTTSDFYMREHASFSDTRQRPWQGWENIAAMLDASPTTLRVLDIGCGNMRFERFLATRFPNTSINADAFDNCAALASRVDGAEIWFQELDVMDMLAHDERKGIPIIRDNDLSVAFGIMHHIPIPEWRIRLIRLLIEHTKPNGLVAFSLWQFMRDERLARQARRTTPLGCAELGITLRNEDGDYLLGWQNVPGVYRYCHSFSDKEIRELIDLAERSGATLADTYLADGASGNLNRYVILKRDVD